MADARVIPLREGEPATLPAGPAQIPTPGQLPGPAQLPAPGANAAASPPATSAATSAASTPTTSATAASTAPSPAQPGSTESAGPAPANGPAGSLGPADSTGPGVPSDVAPAPDRVPAAWENSLAGALAFLRRRVTGDYEVDDFGFDPDLTDHVLLAALRPLYDKWFRVEALGLDNLPDTGGALVVANHSGTIPVDALMASLAVHDHHPARRYLRLLAADLVFTMPVIAPLARKSGNTLASNDDAERLLGAGELVGVFPEGFKGIGKPFSERYKLQRFGRGGFVSAALRTGVPIIPCSIVGAEEIYPMVANLRTLARALGLPYLPVTPTFPLLGPLGVVPLPSKWIIEFGEPIHTEELGAGAAEDPMLVFNLTDQVRETIQQTLYRLLMQRRSVFF